MTTAGELIEEGRRRLRAASDRIGYTGFERADAADLLQHALGHTPRAREEVGGAARRRYEGLIARRARGEPMPYIVGWTEFRGLRLSVRPGAFVPRATTEFLAAQAIRRLRGRQRAVALDLATGIGPVALAVAATVPRTRVYGVDVAAAAVAQARRNARALRLRNVSFHTGDLFAPLPRALRADVITIHPPYVARAEVREMPDEVRRFEPVVSLTDGSDGLRLIHRVAAEAPERLSPDGWLLMEVGSYVSRRVKAIFGDAGFREVRSTQGPMPFTRVIVGRAPR